MSTHCAAVVSFFCDGGVAKSTCYQSMRGQSEKQSLRIRGISYFKALGCTFLDFSSKRRKCQTHVANPK